MFETFKKIYYHKDLRNRLLYAIALLTIFRILAHLPLPGVNLTELRNFFERSQLFGLLDLFSGGTMRNFSIVLMGVGPYITSSIIFQLLVVIIPSLEALQKEGEYGRQKINHYTRICTVPLALLQSYGMVVLLKNQHLLANVSLFQLITTLIITTAGTILLMWLGELISENGIGNGVSLIISLGIISSIPTALQRTFALINIVNPAEIIGLIAFAIMAILATALIIFINEGERQIPVTYARRIRGHRTFGGVETHLPLRVNMGGVIPIIFALSMMIFPGMVAKFLQQARSEIIANVAKYVTNVFEKNTIFYTILYFILVFLFTYFYTSVIFRPQEVAENLQKQGGFVPGLRPGRETADHLHTVLQRITFVGAIFLGFIAVMPFITQFIVRSFSHLNTLVLGGTGLLIVISVVLETVRQVKAQLVMRTYDRY